MDVDGSVKVGEVVAMIKGEGKSLRRKEKRARIEQIRANLGLSDSQRTPAVKLALAFPIFLFSDKEIVFEAQLIWSCCCF